MALAVLIFSEGFGAEEHEKPIIDPSRHTNEFQGRRNRRSEGWEQGGTQIFELPEAKTFPSKGFLFLCAPHRFSDLPPALSLSTF